MKLKLPVFNWCNKCSWKKDMHTVLAIEIFMHIFVTSLPAVAILDMWREKSLHMHIVLVTLSQLWNEICTKRSVTNRTQQTTMTLLVQSHRMRC